MQYRVLDGCPGSTRRPDPVPRPPRASAPGAPARPTVALAGARTGTCRAAVEPGPARRSRRARSPEARAGVGWWRSPPEVISGRASARTAASTAGKTGGGLTREHRVDRGRRGSRRRAGGRHADPPRRDRATQHGVDPGRRRSHEREPVAPAPRRDRSSRSSGESPTSESGPGVAMVGAAYDRADHRRASAKAEPRSEKFRLRSGQGTRVRSRSTACLGAALPPTHNFPRAARAQPKERRREPSGGPSPGPHGDFSLVSSASRYPRPNRPGAFTCRIGSSLFCAETRVADVVDARGVPSKCCSAG